MEAEGAGEVVQQPDGHVCRVKGEEGGCVSGRRKRRKVGEGGKEGARTRWTGRGVHALRYLDTV